VLNLLGLATDVVILGRPKLLQIMDLPLEFVILLQDILEAL
jgi:hypothetical protein